MFFTPIRLEEAFKYQDKRRQISRRRFVAPSFNDVRLILNTAQLYGLRDSSMSPDSKDHRVVELVTFDGDLTLYEDGGSMTSDSPVIHRIMRLLQQRCKVAIVTAAGYAEGEKYYQRLSGLLDAVRSSDALTEDMRNNIVVMGGESNFLFRYDPDEPGCLGSVPREEWLLDEMKCWRDDDITELLDMAESSLRACVSNLNLSSAAVLRKDRSVGIYPVKGQRMYREQLEETVLVVQNTVERTMVGTRLPFCAFNGMHLFYLPFVLP